jgi:hypothetical protein
VSERPRRPVQPVRRSAADAPQQRGRSAAGGVRSRGAGPARRARAQGPHRRAYDFGNASQQLGSAFSGALGGYQDEQNSAAYARDQALYQAELDAARLAIENQQFNPADTDTNYDSPTDNGNPSGAGGGDPFANLGGTHHRCQRGLGRQAG